MKRNRALSMIMAILLVMSVMTIPASAEESAYVPTDTYVLDYNGTYSGAKWQYFSPYWPGYEWDGVADDTTSIAFTLYNTNSGEAFPVYCTDLEVGLDNGSNFRRINLEDSTYAATAAGLLRSIVLKGFPNVSAEALGAAAGVDGLTVGEAVAATQAAIWKAAHGDRVNFTDFCCYIDTEWNPDATAHYAECMVEIENGYAVDENEALIESHIEAAYNYLINLAPTAPQNKLVSGASFVDWSTPEVVANEADENGEITYNVSVTATVDVRINSGDSLTLTAVLGDHSDSVTLPGGSSTHTLTLQNVSEDVAYGDVTLAIDGYQTGSDVYLFDAEGERGTSQSLIGKDDSQLPVHAEVVAETERIINFQKTTPDGRALEGIIFDIYFEGSLSDYLSGNVNMDYAASGLADYTVITDANGNASVNLTQNNMEDGLYLIVERQHTAIVAPVEPIYVVVPMTSEDGSSLVYEINIHPKNEVKDDIDIGKDVIELGNDEATVDAYKNHTWIISASIPADIANGKRYVITDTLDKRLDFAGNVKVQVESLDGTTVAAELTEGTDYVLTVTDVDALAEGYPSDSFTVALTSLGMQKVSSAVGGNFDGHRVRVYFDAQINANAGMGEEIPNQAQIDYTNSVGIGFTDTSDIPVVYTGAINILKVNEKSGVNLEGATFQVYRPATAEEVNDETVTKVTIGEMAAPMVLVEFFDNVELTGTKVTEVTSDANGKVHIYGLAYGTYYLVETKAPAGYNLLADPVEMTIDGESHTEARTVTVVNVAGTELPETGGIGTMWYTVSGMLLICVAGMYFLLMKKRVVR